MVKHRGFSAWIMSEGEEVKEFKPETVGDSGRTMACCIPSERGKKFEIHWKDMNGGIATRGQVIIDGSRVDDMLMCGAQGESTYLEGVATAGEVRPFTFSLLQFTDDDSVNTHASPDLGTITLAIWRVVIAEWMPHFNPPPVNLSSNKPVNERVNKGGSHVVALADTESHRDDRGVFNSAPYSPEDATTPHAVFIFRYRPLDLLQANDIAPRAKPVAGIGRNEPDETARAGADKPAETAQTEDDKRNEAVKVKDEPDHVVKTEDDELADDDEIRALEEKLSALRSRKRRAAQGGETSKKVKSECDFSQCFVKGEVVDLTDL